ncbi:hypothetical protein ADK75_00370 [Streptomyces virginiae]|uniref:DUF4232 domain-containing protein n=1 Tax=Streptomyces virginiae TaxID=1961 RepID=A0A0L8N5J8_STRVG|nr:hypothetical protein [Streptomyces virginiae]KOG57903.1 hypothetical protein ADK75_00370 [Streptomyces virginiae]
MMDDHTSRGGSGASGGSAGSAGSGGEDELRILLRGAVEGLQPSTDALERLRHAVPARRTRNRRAAFVGAAAAVLLAGSAIPTVLHLSGAGSEADDHPAMAGHGEAAGDRREAHASDPHQNGFGDRPRSSRSFGDVPAIGGVTGQPDAPVGSPAGGQTAGPSGTGTTAGPGGSGGSAMGSGPMPPVAAPGVPGCGADQLGVVGSSRPPENDGRVYGSFRVANVSTQACAVNGQDTVTAAPAAGTGTASGPAVAVVGHTAGDPATGLLPDPSAASAALVLPPNTAYEVRFAWVPSGETCAPGNPDGGGKPPQTDSAGTSAGAGSGIASDPGAGAGQTPSGVAVSHTPQPGAATTQTTILEACGGTVYRTGAIPVS